MDYKPYTLSVFEKVFFKLNKHLYFKNHTPILAYSGGKDSTFLLHLFHYLHIQYGYKKPILFHLAHCIRNNAEQEREIESFVQSNFSYQKVFLKKKFLF